MPTYTQPVNHALLVQLIEISLQSSQRLDDIAKQLNQLSQSQATHLSQADEKWQTLLGMIKDYSCKSNPKVEVNGQVISFWRAPPGDDMRLYIPTHTQIFKDRIGNHNGYLSVWANQNRILIYPNGGTTRVTTPPGMKKQVRCIVLAGDIP